MLANWYQFKQNYCQLKFQINSANEIFQEEPKFSRKRTKNFHGKKSKNFHRKRTKIFKGKEQKIFKEKIQKFSPEKNQGNKEKDQQPLF